MLAAALLASVLTTNVMAAIWKGAYLEGPDNEYYTAKHVELFPIAVYSDGKYTDAVTDVRDPKHRLSPLEATRHFALVRSGYRLGSADVVSLFAVGKENGGCTRAVIGTTNARLPELSLAGSLVRPRLALSNYTPVAGSIQAWYELLHSPTNMARFQHDAAEAARVALGKVEHSNPNAALVHPEIMDVYHDGQPEVFARVDGGKYRAFVWLAYTGGHMKILDVTTELAAGGSHAGLNFFDTADIDGDGVDEVVMFRAGDSAGIYEIYRITHDSVRRVFASGQFGC